MSGGADARARARRAREPDGTALLTARSCSSIWVGVPEILGGSNTDHIWMYFHNTSAASAENASAVWDANYTVVWHMNESTGTTITDSCGRYHGTKLTANNPAPVAGFIGGAQSFDGLIGKVVNSEVSSTPNLTLEAWVLLVGITGDYNTIMELGDEVPWFGFWKNGKLTYLRGAAYSELINNINDTSFRQVAVTHEGMVLDFYLDGRIAGMAVDFDVYDTGTGLGVGQHIGDTVFQGVIDEVRVSNIARSEDWMRAQHDSMTDAYLTYSLAETF